MDIYFHPYNGIPITRIDIKKLEYWISQTSEKAGVQPGAWCYKLDNPDTFIYDDNVDDSMKTFTFIKNGEYSLKIPVKFEFYYYSERAEIKNNFPQDTNKLEMTLEAIIINQLGVKSWHQYELVYIKDDKRAKYGHGFFLDETKCYTQPITKMIEVIYD